MKRLIAALAACMFIGVFTGCTEQGKDYVNDKVDKLQEMYKNFDTEVFGQTIKSYFDSAIEKGSEIVGDISGMTNEELAEKIKTALFGDGTEEQKPGLGFDISVEKKDVSETEATVECTISLKVGVTLMEQKVSLNLEQNENDNWVITGCDIGFDKE